jgi:hypothetical protein
MDLVFSFDSEDFLTPQAADAEKWWADELRARNIRGSFQCVAEMIRALKRTGRDDVIGALGWHEIGFHTNYHSVPPTPPEVLEGKSLAEGIDYILRTETPGIATLCETFGRLPISYCSAGDSWTPATLLAMAARGVKVFCDTRLAEAQGRPIWYCGLLTMHYDLAFDSHFGDDEAEEEKFKQRFNALTANIGDDGVMIVFTHPTRLVTERFWDEIFFGAARVPREQWRAAPLRSPATVQRLQDRCRRLLDWIQAKRDVRFVDYATVSAERDEGRRDLAALLRECGLKLGEAGRLPLREPASQDFLTAQSFARIPYVWPIYPKGFTGESLLRQGRQLAWTAAPSKRRK